MRSQLFALPAVLLSACALMPGPVEPVDPLPVQQVAPGVWYAQGESGMASPANRGFMSNAGFVITTEGVVVFDALATPALAEQLLASIRQRTSAPIRRVVVSHYHADHVYGLQVFRREGAEIWAAREGQGYLVSDLAQERLAQRRRDLAPWVDNQTHLVAADRWLGLGGPDRIRFELGQTRFELIDGGSSHTPGDLMLWVPDRGVLFAGDLFFTGRLPFVVDGNTRAWLSALSRIELTQARVVVPGHGSASTNVGEDLRMTASYLRFLREHLGRAVHDLESFDEAYARIDWSAFADEPTFAQANRRNAYSVYLELQNEALEGGESP